MARTHLTLRIPAEDLALIDHEARARGLSRTDYVLRACTGRLPETLGETARRLDALEHEVARLAQLAYE